MVGAGGREDAPMDAVAPHLAEAGAGHVIVGGLAVHLILHPPTSR
jgi:hypothetical protein